MRRTRTRNRRRPPGAHGEAGFTLVEISVGLGISSVMSYFVLNMVVLAYGTYDTGEALIGNQERMDRSGRLLGRELRQADQTTLYASGPMIIFTIPDDVDGDGTVLDGSGNLEFGPAITFRLDQGRLLREQDLDGSGAVEDDVPGERAVVVTGLQDVQFVQEPDGVRFTLTLLGGAGNGGGSPGSVTGWIPTRNATGT